MKLHAHKGRFILTAEYNSALVAKMRAVPGRWFDGKDKFGFGKADTVEFSPEGVAALRPIIAQFGIEVAPEAEQIMTEIEAKAEADRARAAIVIEASRAHDAEIEISGLGGELRPFQRAGVAYALEAKRSFICDEMGLGKTVEALATIHAAEAFPALIVCPASLKLNWQREAEKWLPGRLISVIGGKNTSLEADIVILNYDILGKFKDNLIGFKAVILDESHYIKNHKAQRTIHAQEIGKQAEVRLCLTGTPVLNRPNELLSQLEFLGRLDDLGGFWNFAKRYCNAHKIQVSRGKTAWDFSGAANLDELNDKLRANCYIRRNKADVLTELPAKQRSIVAVEIDNRAEYRKAENELISWLKEQAANDEKFSASIAHLPADEQKKKRAEYAMSAGKKAARAEQLVRIEKLKQLSAQGKMAAVIEWVESFMESGEKLVLFAHHQNIIEKLATQFKSYTITGETPLDKRQVAVDSFQNDPDTKLIICNIKAGGVGLTLTAASNVAFCELGWNPAEHDQAEDRCHRIGQQSSVNAWYLLGAATIDVDIASLIEAKRSVVDAATEGGEVVDNSIMKELIAKLAGVAMPEEEKNMLEMTPQSSRPEPYELIPLDLIDPNPFQPRFDIKPEDVADLAENIYDNGLLQIPQARRVDGRAQSAFGHRRVAAFRYICNSNDPRFDERRAEFATMPLIIKDLTDQKMYEYAASENSNRKDLNPIEVARSIVKAAELGISQQDAGRLHGYVKGATSELVQLLGLPQEIINLISDGKLTASHGRHLRRALAVTANEPHHVVKLGRDAVANEWRASDLQKEVDKFIEKRTTPPPMLPMQKLTAEQVEAAVAHVIAPPPPKEPAAAPAPKMIKCPVCEQDASLNLDTFICSNCGKLDSGAIVAIKFCPACHHEQPINLKSLKFNNELNCGQCGAHNRVDKYSDTRPELKPADLKPAPMVAPVTPPAEPTPEETRRRLKDELMAIADVISIEELQALISGLKGE